MPVRVWPRAPAEPTASRRLDARADDAADPTGHQDADADLHGRFLPAGLRAARRSWFALWPLGERRCSCPGRCVSYAFLHGGAGPPVLQHARAVDVRLRARAAVGRRSATCTSCSPACWPRRSRSCWSPRSAGSRVPTVGASGALFALLLAFGMLFPNRVIMPLFPPIPMKARTFVIVFGVLELLLGV
ncbi:MAG: rhomboid family intramembrane serine protease [Comamonadaceae bacterium]|nr:rhomboid family intramembrane serine protease [Comamonadaceae bacterium]